MMIFALNDTRVCDGRILYPEYENPPLRHFRQLLNLRDVHTPMIEVSD
jgi:hypothetical protein